MDDDSSEWFAPKRYGFGSVPITWQGWALTIGFAAALNLISVALARHPVRLIAAVIPVLTVFIVICVKTTRGGWRWRWGEEDE